MAIAVYWDVDGTLLTSPPRRADLFAVTIEELGGTPVVPEEPREGLPDHLAATLYLEAAGMDPARTGEFLTVLDLRSAAYFVKHPRRVTSGVHSALADVRARGWRQALMSGNTPSRIRSKLFTAGIDPNLFDMRTSVAGDRADDRGDLGERARLLSGDDTLIVVGDTVHDRTAARSAGAAFIAVCADPEVAADLGRDAVAVVADFADPAFRAALDAVQEGRARILGDRPGQPE